MQTLFAFIGGIGLPEVALTLFLIFLFFGAKRIPELAKGLGRGIREFKDATKEIKKEADRDTKPTEAAKEE